MTKLPVLISVPHGGDKTPTEISDQVCLSPEGLFADSDAFTREIYGISESVAAFVDTLCARAFIDLNRDKNDLPPTNPDGVVKTATCHGNAIYTPGNELSPKNISLLLDKYYHPYHHKIRQILAAQPEIQLALDCHSMEAIGPAISPDRGQERPSICLGTNRGKSCSLDTAEKLAKCFQIAFELDPAEITIDVPFSGGFITRTYGNQSTPWVQIEMNRSLYLAEPWFDKSQLSMQKTRLNELREKFQKALMLFFKYKV